MTPISLASRAAAWLPLVLFGAWPFLAFLDHNRDDALIYGARVLLLAGAFIFLLVLVALVLRIMWKRGRTAQIVNALSVFAVMFFTYMPISRMLAGFGITLGTVRLSLWLILSLGLAFLVARLSRSAHASLIANVAGAAMLAVPLFHLAQFTVEGSSAAPATAPETEAPAAVSSPLVTSPAQERHNVYWFILDMYTRADVLEDFLGFDNQGFLEALKERGFVLGEQAVSNYTSTKLSLSSTMSMDYYLPAGEPLHPSMWTNRLQGFNPVVERFGALGYRYIHAEPGGNNHKTRCGGTEERCLTAPTKGAIGISEAEAGLLKLTPLFPVLRVLAPKLLSFDFTEIGDITAQLRPDPQRPHFLFAHILSPHPPARYGKECRRLERIEWELVAEDSEQSRAAYLRDLACLNPQVLKAIDSILAKDRNDPIIIIQGDHGLKLKGLKAPEGSAMEPWMAKHAILSAIRLPAHCQIATQRRFSSVNTFRQVFGCIEGKPMEILPNRIFRYSSNVLTETVADY
jgi:hypothetical protein